MRKDGFEPSVEINESSDLSKLFVFIPSLKFKIQ